MEPRDEDLENRLTAALVRPRNNGSYSEQVRQAARLTLLDSIGVGLGTHDHPAVAAARHYVERYVAGAEAARVWGTDTTSTVEGALLANTVPLRCYDFNDVLHGASGQAGHPSDFIPGLIAVAEAEGRSGRDLLDAVIAAYDATKLLFDSFNVSQRGWDYANLVGLGAVCGFAALSRLAPEEAAHALGIFASSHIATNQLESGDLSSSGNLTMWKRFNGADAVLAALRACRLASCGVEAPANSLLGDHGFYRQLSDDNADPVISEHDADDAAPRGIELTEFKQWPVGTRAQSAIMAALECRAQLAVDQPISSVTVEVESAVAEHLVRAEAFGPHSRETADHSLPFIVALALLEGDVTIDHFNTERFFHEPRVNDLLTKIQIKPSPASAREPRSSFPARVVVRSGNRDVAGTGEYPPEKIRAVAFGANLDRKFQALAGRILPDEQVGQARDAIIGVDDLDDITVLTKLLATR